ncbi:MAG: hypothetical protein CMF12_05930 [Idiomarina sp.]|uniref:hypothetical protein n=1 Tax=Idiomarina sp. TaxID=1874361 RepID=UPI000C593471|nr:hypothetical protein [Idiomarina sp.]MBT42045.1 hypothetical protein [Idiomarina sp.]
MTQPQQRIAFIASNKNPLKFAADPAFIYRCQNPALALQAQGHRVYLQHVSTLLSTFGAKLSQPTLDIAVFHRPCARTLRQRWQLYQLFKKLRQRGTRLIADFDDRVFATEFAADSPGVRNGYVSQQQTAKNFAQHQQLLHYFDAFSVSTQPLQAALQQQVQVPVHCLPNAPHKSWYAQTPSQQPAKPFVLKYLPGTRSHDQDFALIAATVSDFLQRHQDAELHITGVLERTRLPAALANSPQVIWQPKQPYEHYWQTVNAGHVHLAPLEDTPFNRGKSALKAIEAGFFNRPTIASPIPDMQRLVNAGVSFAHTPADWAEQLEYHKLHNDPLPTHLRQQVLDCYSAEQQAHDLLQRVAVCT